MPIDPRTGETARQTQATDELDRIRRQRLERDRRRQAARIPQVASHNTVYLADLEAGGTRIGNTKHFTLSESGSWPVDWTADSKTLIVRSTTGAATTASTSSH